jgi:hypothetical protein
VLMLGTEVWCGAGLKCSGVENHPSRFIDKPGVTVQLEVSRRRGTALPTRVPRPRPSRPDQEFVP